MTAYTVEMAKQWTRNESKQLDAARMTCDDGMVQMLNKMSPDKSKALWDSGCWLVEQLRSHGGTDEEVSSIQMAQGQRAFGGDAWQAAVYYANEFAATGDTEEKGGRELAEKRHSELFGSDTPK